MFTLKTMLCSFFSIPSHINGGERKNKLCSPAMQSLRAMIDEETFRKVSEIMLMLILPRDAFLINQALVKI